ncbi:PKD-like family lipoprotein [Chitinophaga sedimenti]|uniref:PKD-like family lipoprotein n=1 Tax=Chitinophaga sedimenti TaxID=2033606 RepID=UPI002005FF74|nr:PKD-like family lipoprotein [Chitinophaga sedimenti]MCK7557405.1 PKD-like family lipoprotein [Chitinophaga sedimenti]
MKKNNLLYIICTLAVGMCSLNACYKPTTNYDFHDINEIRVDSFGSYLEVVQFDTLTVTPHITASMDPSVLDDTTRYTYEWLAGKPGVTYTAHQLGNKRNLKVRLNIPVGSYRLYFTMKDKLTGQIANMRSVRLDVTSKTFEGWLILSDVQGNAALDFVNWNSNGTKTIVRNLLDNSPICPSR